MKNNLPIKILSARKNKDGSLDIEFEYSHIWVDRVKEDLRKDRVTKTDIKNHLLKILTQAAEKTIDKI